MRLASTLPLILAAALALAASFGAGWVLNETPDNGRVVAELEPMDQDLIRQLEDSQAALQEARAARQELAGELEDLRARLDEVTAERDALAGQVEDLQGRLQSATQAREDLSSRIEALNDRIAELRTAAETARAAAAEAAQRESRGTAETPPEPAPNGGGGGNAAASLEEPQPAQPAEAGPPQPPAETAPAGETAPAVSAPPLGELTPAETARTETSPGNDGWAQLRAAVDAYEDGDYRRAARLWLPLAQRGVSRAQLHLGALFLEGRGVAEDPVLAWAWLTLAERHGSQAAPELLDRLTPELTETQLAEARRLIGE